ncbi:hypothetical protein GCM10010358_75390 [Streptomyces minutiscleroticus]|uniref:Uncharacterized protein n=1 Tax=Streptomyces minutiscleroticus TaxID=68238 RepID=A0A918P0P0_9ACTN|nr:hypothetical protein [Streptomyces minutiscleroticus]GGY11860.1 hypothetical protein GCM10010358_75390 [Streptomyces minutiscleroticus]
MTAVIATAEFTYRVPLGFPELSACSRVHMAEEWDAFLRVLVRGRNLLLRPGALSNRPGEAARQLPRLWSEQGVPLALSLRWCRETAWNRRLCTWHSRRSRTRHGTARSPS